MGLGSEIGLQKPQRRAAFIDAATSVVTLDERRALPDSPVAVSVDVIHWSAAG